MKKATTMYRTITATLMMVKGIQITDGKEQIVEQSLRILYDKDFQIDGTGIEQSGGTFYPAFVTDRREVTYKCTMDEDVFVANADKVESRFVNGRTRMVTRNVSTYSATCLCYNMETQQMINSVFSLPEDKGAEKNLSYLKKHYEEQGKFIIATVLNVSETTGIYAMTERKFFELAGHEEVTE